jgi:hypothetical protein
MPVAKSNIYTKLLAIQTKCETIAAGLNLLNFECKISVGKKFNDYLTTSNLTDKIFVNAVGGQNFVFTENNAAFMAVPFNITLTSKFCPIETDNLPENLLLLGEALRKYFNDSELFSIVNYSLEYIPENQTYAIFINILDLDCF